jgi:hypothetical protein
MQNGYVENLNIAIVPLEDTDDIDTGQIHKVATALQMQVDEDLRRYWGVSAIVRAFPKLECVSAEYLPLALVTRELPEGHAGFHFTMGGLPFALVQYDDDISRWSVAASHELVEMVVDPHGDRTKLGPSLKDEQHKATETTDNHYVEQGTVDYLVEVCDPCKTSTYEIAGVEVSDFVTPAYYSAADIDRQYTCQNQISRPRRLLEGGEISWRTRTLDYAIYQASPSVEGAEVGPADMEITELGNTPSMLSRASIHYYPRTPEEDRKNGRPTDEEKETPPPSNQNERFAYAFRIHVKELLKALDDRPPRPPSIQDVIDLLKKLEKQKEVDTTLLDEYNIPHPAKLTRVDPEHTDLLIERLEQQKKASGLFGPDLFDPQFALWLCMLTD